MRRVYVLGVGMTPFVKPGASADYPAMVEDAVRQAFADATVGPTSIEQAFAGYVYGESTCGQRALYPLGIDSVPIFNVNNNCSTGSTALFLANQAIAGGNAECVLALGFEKMEKGALGIKYGDRANPLESHFSVLTQRGPLSAAPFAAQMFGAAGKEYQDKYGAKKETFAKISAKARKHAAHNPRALFREPLTVEQVLASDLVFDPLTRLQCCPPTCGAAAAILCSEEFAKRHSLSPKVWIAGQAMATDSPESFAGSMMAMVGAEMGKRAADNVYHASGVDPKDVDLVELHDCFTANELLSYESLSLCPVGGAEKFIEDGDNTYGGKYVTNPSGGLLAKGHPLGATGLAQCAEIYWQLQGRAMERQVAHARIGLQHNVGLGGACVVTLYRND